MISRERAKAVFNDAIELLDPRSESQVRDCIVKHSSLSSIECRRRMLDDIQEEYYDELRELYDRRTLRSLGREGSSDYEHFTIDPESRTTDPPIWYVSSKVFSNYSWFNDLNCNLSIKSVSLDPEHPPELQFFRVIRTDRDVPNPLIITQKIKSSMILRQSRWQKLMLSGSDEYSDVKKSELVFLRRVHMFHYDGISYVIHPTIVDDLLRGIPASDDAGTLVYTPDEDDT